MRFLDFAFGSARNDKNLVISTERSERRDLMLFAFKRIFTKFARYYAIDNK
jgi:hypothetical protein